jgi:hypothetical protein
MNWELIANVRRRIRMTIYVAIVFGYSSVPWSLTYAQSTSLPNASQRTPTALPAPKVIRLAPPSFSPTPTLSQFPAATPRDPNTQSRPTQAHLFVQKSESTQEFLEDVPIREAIPFAKPVPDPEVKSLQTDAILDARGDRLLQPKEGDLLGSDDLFQQRERAAMPYPRPDFSAPAEFRLRLPSPAFRALNRNRLAIGIYRSHVVRFHFPK